MQLKPALICVAVAALSPRTRQRAGRPLRTLAAVRRLLQDALRECGRQDTADISDRRLTINFDGKTAKDVFNTMGPDLPTTCSGETGDRAREKKGITCIYTGQDANSKAGPYRCWIGLNLKTGDTIRTSSC